MLNLQEIMHYWYYFCSLCARLSHTQQYVDHSLVGTEGNRVLANKDTYSNEFLQIILSTAAEFETVGKLFCRAIDASFKENSNIVLISETIIQKYPKITQTRVSTSFQSLTPLATWKIEAPPDHSKMVVGLDWWKAYTDIKHKRCTNFSKATLENCINALASLLVLELYLAMHILGSVSDLSTHVCEYFNFRYGHEQFWVKCPQNLPDF